MEKISYIAPEAKTIEIQMSSIICVSGDENNAGSYNYGGELGDEPND